MLLAEVSFIFAANSVREELNQLSKTQLLKSEKNGRQVFYTVNREHPLFPKLKSMVGMVMGMDQVIDTPDWVILSGRIC